MLLLSTNCVGQFVLYARLWLDILEVDYSNYGAKTILHNNPKAMELVTGVLPRNGHGGGGNGGDIKDATSNYVGFANIPNQVFRKAVKRGFDFTLMVVGM